MILTGLNPEHRAEIRRRLAEVDKCARELAATADSIAEYGDNYSLAVATEILAAANRLIRTTALYL